ncbi:MULTISPECIES: phasin family protein [Bradyrhizobium]|uniref:Phasin family protein n=1 Tax=Bradyrhizobium elkanii TaxID=29448 RepID=A0A4U6S6A9_BRAEL|nr:MULTISPECIES: phasin family protein [Bradyrhizobium]MTV18932.1 phasin family protein [Bradyrhizobium sp. BR2003]TKV83304.1 phasin family protein [Bradyrhizobium elkanii]
MGTDDKQSDAAGTGAMLWLGDLKKMAEKFTLPGFDIAALVEWQRKDMEALAEANRQAYEGIQALVSRRNEILQETLAQWQAAMQDLAGGAAMTKQAEAAKQQVEKAVADFRELSQMEAQARNNAWKVMQERMQENLANLQKLLQPK